MIKEILELVPKEKECEGKECRYNSGHFDCEDWQDGYNDHYTDTKKALEGVKIKGNVEEIYKILYNRIRPNCASEKCDKTCPGFELDCGIRKEAKDLTQAISDNIERLIEVKK